MQLLQLFLTRIYIILFLSFAILKIDSCAGRDEPWSSTSNVITFDQNWHHLYSTSSGGKDLSNNTQIRVLSLMAPEICKKLSEKLGAKFPAIARGYSMVKHLDGAFSEVFLITSKPIRQGF